MNILPIAVKFVSWDVSPLDTLKNSRAYMLREKLDGNGKMDRAEKNWLAENVRNNFYFRTANGVSLRFCRCSPQISCEPIRTMERVPCPR